jgi:hypothetical protein
MSNATDALTYTAEGAGVGAALGLVGAAMGGGGVLPAVVGGATVGMGVVALGGLAIGVFSSSERDEAFETAGIALGLSFLTGLVGGALLVAANKTA